MPSGTRLLDDLLLRCTFPPAGTAVTCAFSGGRRLHGAARAGERRRLRCHGDPRRPPAAPAHRQRKPTVPNSSPHAIGVAFRRHTVDVAAGPQPRGARPGGAGRRAPCRRRSTGHTADDQAETVLINLLRGAGASGLAAMRPGPTKPLLALRRAETVALCADLGLDPLIDPSNADRRFLRNRVRERGAAAALRRRRARRRAVARCAPASCCATTTTCSTSSLRPSTPPTPAPWPLRLHRLPAARCATGWPGTATRPTSPRSTGRSTLPAAWRRRASWAAIAGCNGTVSASRSSA